MNDRPPPAKDGSETDPVYALAEAFLHRVQQGEKLTVEQYASQHPQHGDRLRDLCNAMLTMESLKPGSQDLTVDTAAGPAGRPMHRRGLATSASCARSGAAAWASSTRPSRSRWAAASL